MAANFLAARRTGGAVSVMLPPRGLERLAIPPAGSLPQALCFHLKKRRCKVAARNSPLRYWFHAYCATAWINVPHSDNRTLGQNATDLRPVPFFITKYKRKEKEVILTDAGPQAGVYKQRLTTIHTNWEMRIWDYISWFLFLSAAQRVRNNVKRRASSRAFSNTKIKPRTTSGFPVPQLFLFCRLHNKNNIIGNIYLNNSYLTNVPPCNIIPWVKFLLTGWER